MHLNFVSFLRLGWVGLFAASLSFGQLKTTLKPSTEEAFDRYRRAEEGRMTWTPRFSDPAPGTVTAAPTPRGAEVPADDSMIHDWSAAMYVPGATVEQAVAVLQNYPEYKKIYAPEIVDAKVLSRDGNRWRVFLKLLKKYKFTAILNSEYDIDYIPLDRGRWSMVSHSTRIAEMDDGKELPVGTGHGYLWRLNAYWLLEPRPQGVYLECRSISLTRNIPTGLGWLLRPLVSSLPRESLENTLRATLKALRG